MTDGATYKAEMFGSAWAAGPIAHFATIRECREWAEEYGTTADACVIRDTKNRVVARHKRSNAGSGTQWYRASVARFKRTGTRSSL